MPTTKEQLEDARQTIDDTERLAMDSGLPVQDRHDEYDGGVVYRDHKYPHTFTENPSLVTQDAAIGVIDYVVPEGEHGDWTEKDPGGHRYAEVTEQTGVYNAVIPGENSNNNHEIRAEVSRDAGDGEVYTATLSGENAKRAGAIIATRAAERIAKDMQKES